MSSSNTQSLGGNGSSQGPTAGLRISQGPPPGLPVSQELVAQRITATEFFRTRAGLTICAATLQNGYIAVGHSPASFGGSIDPAEDRALALAEAQRHVMPLLGYQLCEALWSLEHPQDAAQQQRQLSQIVGGRADAPMNTVESSKAQGESGDTTTAGGKSATPQSATERSN